MSPYGSTASPPSHLQKTHTVSRQRIAHPLSLQHWRCGFRDNSCISALAYCPYHVLIGLNIISGALLATLHACSFLNRESHSGRVFNSISQSSVEFHVI
jgi:hypothetical protein